MAYVVSPLDGVNGRSVLFDRFEDAMKSKDTGFTADGTFVTNDELHHAGMVLYRER